MIGAIGRPVAALGSQWSARAASAVCLIVMAALALFVLPVPRPSPEPPPAVPAPLRMPAPAADHARLAAVAARMVAFEPSTATPAAIADARQANAAQPFAQASNPLAAPFFATAPGQDHERAADCLAAAAFYEAGDDPVGQRSVVQVVLNRVRHPAYGASVCGVVFQGSERNSGCQFTFTCDGALRRTPSPAAWLRARQVAERALGGAVDASVGIATHYHTDWVHPRWSPLLDKVARVRTHLFFRWRGRWGTPGAFSVAYGGIEPRVAKLAMLSPAHRPAPAAGMPMLNPLLAAEVAAIEPAAPTATPAGPERLSLAPSAPDTDTFLVTLRPGLPADHLAMAARTCGRRSYCKVVGWSDPGRAVATMPIPGSAIDAISFLYVRDATGGTGKARWNCREFPRADGGDCLSGASPDRG